MLRPNNNPLWSNWNSYLPDIMTIPPPHQCRCNNSKVKSKRLRWSSFPKHHDYTHLSFEKNNSTILFKTWASSGFSDSKLIMGRRVEGTRYKSNNIFSTFAWCFWYVKFVFGRLSSAFLKPVFWQTDVDILDSSFAFHRYQITNLSK